MSKLVLALLIVLTGLLWSQHRFLSVDAVNLTLHSSCAPLSFPQQEQCAHVLKHCEKSQTLLNFPYLQSYFCSTPAVRPLAFAGLVTWLIFLFSMLGIAASDFFCPNLATIAAVLGLDENVAGVTFLAFGNGSPDLFSTFSAMKAHSGSLAVGELLGAATFIISVVVGCMCVIKPFHVHRYPFLRDVGFFTTAVATLLFILMDGFIKAWEAGLLVILYAGYVTIVVAGSWWQRRQDGIRLKDEQIRSEFADQEIGITEPYRDDDSNHIDDDLTLLAPPPTSRSRAYSHPSLPSQQTRNVPLELVTSSAQFPARPRSRSRAHSHHHDLPSFSLLGALEFRSVISSLQHQSAVLDIFDSPVTPFAAGHYHRHPSFSDRRTSQRLSAIEGDNDPWDAVLDGQNNNRDSASERQLHVFPGRQNQTPVPSIMIRSPDDSPVMTTRFSPPESLPKTRQRNILDGIQSIGSTLFPTLHHFREKSILGMIAAVFAIPAVLVFTLTLPVVITQEESCDPQPLKGLNGNNISQERLVDVAEENDIQQADGSYLESYPSESNKWLIATQCSFGPVFGAAVIFGITRKTMWYLTAAALFGVSLSTLSILFSEKRNMPSARLARCFLGFFVAVVWIMAIADEVVQVLQTFGLVFGLSDAIIGLTIFAVGNSLADFVADITVAAYAPIMGFSACFGGPMLNILLGIGLSGTFIIRQTGEDYQLHFSRTLLISTVGLLSILVVTLLFVPWNGFLLSKRWGIFLIGCYCAIMVVNVVAESRES